MGKKKNKKKNKEGGASADASKEEDAAAVLINLGEEPSKEEAGKIFGDALNTMQNSAEEVMVDLKHTRIGDKRAKSLIKALEQGAPNLTLLDLSHNTISDVGADLLAGVLADGKAPKLSLLNLTGNPGISSECRDRIEEKLKGRKGLVLELNLPQPAAQEVRTPEPIPLLMFCLYSSSLEFRYHAHEQR